MPTTAIVNATLRNVQGQISLTGNPTTPPAAIQIPLLPLNGSFAIKGRITAVSSDESGSQSIEVDYSGNMANGMMTYASQTPTTTTTPAGSLPNAAANASAALTASGTTTRQPVFSLTNGAAAGTAGVTLFWSWNLTVERCATM